jgi:hypothetical protein
MIDGKSLVGILQEYSIGGVQCSPIVKFEYGKQTRKEAWTDERNR